MNKMDLIVKLASLPGIIAEQEVLVLNAVEKVQDCKRVLLEAEDVLYSSGQIDGKNAEIRQAQLRAKTSAERQALQDAENQLNMARVKLNRFLNELTVYKAIAGLLRGVE